MSDGSENASVSGANSLEDSHQFVFTQLQDVVRTQKRLISTLCEKIQDAENRPTQEEFDNLQQELENERDEHERTRALLDTQSEKLQFALGEIEILTAQLTREKAVFEASFNKVRHQALKETNKNHTLAAECTSIKAEKEKQEDLLAFKDAKISDLKKRLASQKESHHRQLEEINIQQQQEAYISRNLATASHRGRGRSGKR
ncbi:spermatogenesis-associated protein 24-like [Diadema setosum]|uniref:spermatogenesis-associated protein 24-like n=1 Tax=Diadema setosum TaxID=31175 RepID=UPI003B3A6017